MRHYALYTDDGKIVGLGKQSDEGIEIQRTVMVGKFGHCNVLLDVRVTRDYTIDTSTDPHTPVPPES